MVWYWVLRLSWMMGHVSQTVTHCQLWLEELRINSHGWSLPQGEMWRREGRGPSSPHWQWGTESSILNRGCKDRWHNSIPQCRQYVLAWNWTYQRRPKWPIMHRVGRGAAVCSTQPPLLSSCSSTCSMLGAISLSAANIVDLWMHSGQHRWYNNSLTWLLGGTMHKIDK